MHERELQECPEVAWLDDHLLRHAPHRPHSSYALQRQQYQLVSRRGWQPVTRVDCTDRCKRYLDRRLRILLPQPRDPNLYYLHRDWDRHNQWRLRPALLHAKFCEQLPPVGIRLPS